MTSMKTKPSRTDLINLTFVEGSRENFVQRSCDRNRRGYSSLGGRSRYYNNFGVSYIWQHKSRDTGDSRQQRLRHQSRPPARWPSITSRSSSGDKDRCFCCKQFDHFTKTALRRMPVQANCSRQKKDWLSSKKLWRWFRRRWWWRRRIRHFGNNVSHWWNLQYLPIKREMMMNIRSS